MATAMRPYRLLSKRDVCVFCQRSFSTSARTNSGHNKWSKIKHDKAAADAKKNRRNTIFAHEIVAAIKNHGGSDPATNPRLAAAIENAKKARWPKTSIEHAILRGEGKSTNGNPIETLTFEAMAPGGVGIIFECETDQKKRALQDIRYILGKHDAKTSPTEYLFSRRGRIGVSTEREDALEYIMDKAIEAGALDVQEVSPGEIVVDTEPADLNDVKEKLAGCEDLTIESVETPWTPNEDTSMRDVQADRIESLNALATALTEYSGVEVLYCNIIDRSLGRLPLEMEQ